MKVHDLEIDSAQLSEIAAHAEEAYPDEACGLGFKRKGEGGLVRIERMENVQNRYHQLDPKAFPRTARDAFRMDELKRMRALEAAAAEGLEECLVYHSHCDAGAYFSPEDRAMAVRDGIELVPGAVNLVVSVRSGTRSEMAAYRYDGAAGFVEDRVDLASIENELPDLELRAMEGRESARPIPPVGGRLAPRLVTGAERTRIAAMAQGARVELDDRSEPWISLFGAGWLSPVTGFQRAAEVASVEGRGRLLSGAPWLTPISLTVKPKGLTLSLGSVVELVDASGRAVGAMGVADLVEHGAKLQLGGPLFVYAVEGGQALVADVRAELVRRGAEKVLALPEGAQVEDVSEFDAVLGVGQGAIEVGRLEPSWLGAAAAQNLGATHFHSTDSSLRRMISDTLDIAVWPERL